MDPDGTPALKDITILNEIREVFHASTGLTLSFQYLEKEYVFYPAPEKNSYCKTIQSSPQGLRRCKKSDLNALLTAKRTGEPCTFTCHAGLVNAVIPLICKGHDLGAFFTGQVLEAPHSEETFDAVYRGLVSLGIPRKMLLAQYRTVKVFDSDRFLLGVRLLSFMANYIVTLEREMSLQTELHRRERESLRNENAQIKSQSEMQKLSISVLEHGMKADAHASYARASSTHKGHIVARAQEYMNENYGLPLRLADVAKAVYLSPNHFSRIFRERTGQTFNSYLNDVRVQNGRTLLMETEIPIKRIVSMVGFEDYNYFNRIFTKLIGVPPATFRATCQRKPSSPRDI